MLTAQELGELEKRAQAGDEDELRVIITMLLAEIRRLHFGMSP